jgi:phage gp36-like protein
MPYATQTDMVNRFGELEIIQLTDRADPPAGAIDAVVLGEALADADSLVDGYVGAAYTLPLPVIPSDLTRVSADIARYFLYKDNPPEVVRQNYEDALKLLQAIAKGQYKLPGIDEAPTSDASAGTVETSGPARVMSRETLRGL